MKTIGTTLVGMFVLIAAGSALGLANNALRDDGIKLSKSYFAKAVVPTSTEPAATDGAAADRPDDEPAPGQRDHIFQVITLREVQELIDDPLYPGEVGILIDARGDEAFEEGHIVYARQMNPYYAERYLPDLLPEIAEADLVVVYCAGGECEDSVFACRELLDADVPFERIYLFAGGMEAWESADGPIDEGRY